MTRRFGTIRKRPSGRFQAIYHAEAGGGRQISRTFDTEGQAEDWLAEERTRIRRGDWNDPRTGSITLSQFFEIWVAGRPLAPRTSDLYWWLWRRCIAETLGHLEVRKITPTMVRSWHAAMCAAERPGPTTIAKSYRLLSAAMSDAVRDGLVQRHPCTVVGAGVEPRRPITVLSVEQVESLANEIPHRLRCLVLVAAYGGLRWGELAGLRPSDVDAARCCITISQTLSERQNGSLSFGPPKSSAGYRTVVLPASVMAELIDHVELFSAIGLVFTTSTGKPLRRCNFGQKIWRPATERAGVAPLRFHDLRHTAATLATRHGATVREVQARLGHASPAAALRYQHVVASSETELANRLDSLRTG